MLPIAALTAALVMLASSCGAQSGATVAATLSKSAGPIQIARPHAVVGSGGSWTMYHHDDAHTGTHPAAPALTAVHPSAGSTETALDEEVYAAPLLYNWLALLPPHTHPRIAPYSNTR